MGTRIEPTISNPPVDALSADDTVPAWPDAGNPGTAASHVEADASTDPTLAELAALENEVDNWLHAPAKAGPAAIGPEPLRGEMRDEPEPARVDIVDAPARPDTPPPPAPRKKRPVGWWALGAAAFAAIAGAVVLLDEPATPGQPFAPAAASTPAPSAAPAQAAIAPVPAPPPSKPEMVFLEQPGTAVAKAAGPEAKPAGSDPAVKPQQPDTAGIAVAEPAAPVKAKKAVSPKKAKPVKKPAPAPEVREPEQRTQTWPPDRRSSDAQRVEAARAACRARSRDPAACHIRVCDVLGSSHPACRE